MPGSVLLSAAALTKRYTLATEVVIALDNVTFEIHTGDFLAVMGPSGSGKTTLLHLLAGLDRPTEGSLYWREQEFSELPERDLARLRSQQFGFVFQDACLMSGLDAFGNTRLPHVLTGSTDGADRARHLLEQFGLGSRLHRLPSQLSRGEKQRVAVARALMNEPALLLADEPTGNLDRAATVSMFEMFKELNENSGLTILVATHDESILEHATGSMILSDGRLVSGLDE